MKTRIVGIAIAILFISVAFTGSVAALDDFSDLKETQGHYLDRYPYGTDHEFYDEEFYWTNQRDSVTNGPNTSISGTTGYSISVTEDHIFVLEVGGYVNMFEKGSGNKLNEFKIDYYSGDYTQGESQDSIDVRKEDDGNYTVAVLTGVGGSADFDIDLWAYQVNSANGNVIKYQQDYSVHPDKNTEVMIHEDGIYTVEYDANTFKRFTYDVSSNTFTRQDVIYLDSTIEGITYNEGNDEIIAYQNTGTVSTIPTSDISTYTDKTGGPSSTYAAGLYTQDGSMLVRRSSDLGLSDLNSWGTIDDTTTKNRLENLGVYAEISDSGTYMSSLEDDELKVYQLKSIPSSIDSKVNGSQSAQIYGSNSFEINTTLTYKDGSTKDVNSSTTYSGYDTNIIQQNASTNEFNGTGVGTTTITATYSSGGSTFTDTISVTVNKPVTNADLLLTGSDDAVFNGTEQETYATEITYHNGTTEYANDSKLSYSYDSSIIVSVSDVYTNLETFEGQSAGTTTISSTYTGFDGATTSTGDTTITVNNPPKLTSVEFVNATTNNKINGSITLEQGESYAIKQKNNYADGTSTYSTSNLGTRNSTEVSLSGNTYTAQIYGVDGQTDGYGTWSQPFRGTGGLVTFDINIVAEPESVNLQLARDEIKQGQEVSYTVDTTYENGTVIDETSKATMSYNGTKKGGGVTFDNQNGTINATGFGTIKITSTINPSDSEVLTVEPSVKWNNYDNLNNQERLMLSFSDIEFLALFVAAIIGVAFASKVNMVAGVGSTSMTIFLSWAVGILPIYMPILLTIFLTFIGFSYQFLDLSTSTTEP